MERLPTILADLIGPGPTKDQLLETAMNDRITLTAGTGLIATLMAVVIICGAVKLLERNGRNQRLPEGHKMAILAIATSVAIGACAGFITWQTARPQAKEGLYDVGAGNQAKEIYAYLDRQWYFLGHGQMYFSGLTKTVEENQLPGKLRDFPEIYLRQECKTETAKQELADEYDIDMLYAAKREGLLNHYGYQISALKTTDGEIYSLRPSNQAYIDGTWYERDQKEILSPVENNDIVACLKDRAMMTIDTEWLTSEIPQAKESLIKQ